MTNIESTLKQLRDTAPAPEPVTALVPTPQAAPEPAVPPVKRRRKRHGALTVASVPTDISTRVKRRVRVTFVETIRYEVDIDTYKTIDELEGDDGKDNRPGEGVWFDEVDEAVGGWCDNKAGKLHVESRELAHVEEVIEEPKKAAR